jgi:hypothetical protein
MKRSIFVWWNYLFNPDLNSNHERKLEMNKRGSILIQVFIVMVALAGSIYVAVAPANSLLNWYNIDDAFYYYKVAQNVIAGHGFTFDGINLTNGFHPLWMVVCLSVFWLSKINLLLPLRVLVIVSGLFNAGTALVLYKLLRKFIHPYAALLGSLIWALTPAIYGTTTVHGMEAAISAFFMVLLIYQAAKFLDQENQGQNKIRQLLLLGLIGALTILSRLDNVFVVAFVGLFVIFRIKKISSALIYDWAALGLAVVASWVLRLGLTDAVQNMYSIYPIIAIAFIVFPIVYYFFGMYEGFNQKSIWSRILLQVGAGIVNLILMYGIASVIHHLGILKMLSRSVIVLFVLISFIFILCLRLLQQKNNSMAGAKPLPNFLNWIKGVWKKALVEGIAYAIPIGVIIGIYCLINKLFFGTFTPVSGQIKTWWNTLPNTVYSHPNTIISILGLSPNGNFGPWAIITSKVNNLSGLLLRIANVPDTLNSFIFILLTILLLFMIAAILKAQENRLGKLFFKIMAPAVLIGCLSQIAYYTTIGYAHTRSWYWVSEILVTILLVSVILDGLFTWIEKAGKKTSWVSISIVLVSIAVILFYHQRYITSFIPMKVAPGKAEAYLGEVHQVESLTPKGSIIGMTGGGMVAYFIQDRTIVNLDGLINSAEYFHALKTGTTTKFLDAIPLNFVYGNEYVVGVSDPYGEILKDRIREIGMIQGYESFTLYQYVINN